MDSEEGLTTEDGKDDEEEEMKICFYIPALLSNSVCRILSMFCIHFKSYSNNNNFDTMTLYKM
jgi:hypothetical protein